MKVFTKKNIVFSFLFAFFQIVFAQSQNSYYLLIGTYTDKQSKGVQVYDFDANSGNVQFISSVESSNPSYLLVHPNKKWVYSVNENADSTGSIQMGGVTAYRFEKGKLSIINQVASGGKHPCHLVLDESEKWLLVSNYSSGSVGVLPLLMDGKLGNLSQLIQHKGKGKDALRQTNPHAHSSLFIQNNTSVIVQDLGIDQIKRYHFNAKTGTLTPYLLQPSLALPAGSGPRLATAHPALPYFYVIEELTNKIAVIQIDIIGILKTIQEIPTLSTNFLAGTAADIHISKDGKFLYASTRGDNNLIALFSINDKDGRLSFVGQYPSMGKTPRYFSLDPTEQFLLVANQDSDNIALYKRDKKTGKLVYTEKNIKVYSPVCLEWIPKK